MPKNNTNTMPQPYDPVPPYDLDDVEANAADHPPQTNSSHLHLGDDVGEGGSGSGSNVVDPSQESRRGRGREGKLTERECCDYAFLYFKTVVLGLVLMTFFISLFSYLGRKH
jgi:hypothetical protein